MRKNELLNLIFDINNALQMPLTIKDKQNRTWIVSAYIVKRSLSKGSSGLHLLLSQLIKNDDNIEIKEPIYIQVLKEKNGFVLNEADKKKIIEENGEEFYKLVNSHFKKYEFRLVPIHIYEKN
jgi:hypothetical protein